MRKEGMEAAAAAADSARLLCGGVVLGPRKREDEEDLFRRPRTLECTGAGDCHSHVQA